MSWRAAAISGTSSPISWCPVWRVMMRVRPWRSCRIRNATVFIRSTRLRTSPASRPSPWRRSPPCPMTWTGIWWTRISPGPMSTPMRKTAAPISQRHKQIPPVAAGQAGFLCFKIQQKNSAPNFRSAVFLYKNQAFLAISVSWVKAAASLTASSASILRLISMPATFRPCMKVE